MKYPSVVGEWETLDVVLSGKSLTRYGDGEFRLAMGGAQNVSQVNSPALQKELARILVTPQTFCLIGIPDMNPESPKWWFWKKYPNKYPRMLNPQMTYYSQFITRPDSAPAIDVPAFYDKMETLWREQDVVLVRGSDRSLVEGCGTMRCAKSVHTVMCARRDAYADINQVERQVMDVCATHGVKRVLLCAGAMATVLAYRLARHGLHAIDLGHIGYLWRLYERRSKKDPEQEIKEADLRDGVRLAKEK